MAIIEYVRKFASPTCKDHKKKVQTVDQDDQKVSKTCAPTCTSRAEKATCPEASSEEDFRCTNTYFSHSIHPVLLP